MAGLLSFVGFPFLSTEHTPDTICTGTVYTWNKNFIQGAIWKAHRLTLFADGALVWDDPQNNRLKGCAKLDEIFRRIGIGTLYNSAGQQKSAAKYDLTILEYGLLLPFNRGDGGLELNQFGLASLHDLHKWIEAFSRQMNASHLLDMVVENRSNLKLGIGGKRESVLLERYWVEEWKLGKDRKVSYNSDGPMLNNFKEAECADIWRELQETYNLCTAARGGQRINGNLGESMRRAWSMDNKLDEGHQHGAGDSHET